MFFFCVYWLTEARKQVKDATEKLGGQYSPNLHPRCTHLVVQISFFSFRYFIYACVCCGVLCIRKKV